MQHKNLEIQNQNFEVCQSLNYEHKHPTLCCLVCPVTMGGAIPSSDIFFDGDQIYANLEELTNVVMGKSL